MNIEANGNQGYFSGRGWRVAGIIGRNAVRLANCIFIVIGLLLTVSVMFADWGSDEMISMHAVRDGIAFLISGGAMFGLCVYVMLGKFD